MEFKKVDWVNEVTGLWSVKAPFGLTLDVVREMEGRYYWEFGNAYTFHKKGRCTTIESAKLKCEKAYHNYVLENLGNC